MKDDSGRAVPSVDRRTVLKSAVAVGAGSGLLSVGSTSVAAGSGGPVFLMGIDAEDNWEYSHGPESLYANVIDNIISNVDNGNVSGGTGPILVIGAKSGTDTGGFWTEMQNLTGNPVTMVDGSTDISNATFGNYAMIGVVSSQGETPSGGLTDAENDALVARKADVASFVDSGGGLLGFTQAYLTNPWAYVGDVGSFSIQTNLGYDDVRATSAGNAIGITDSNLDVCCLHDVFLDYPGFLDVLAINDDSGSAYVDDPAVIGGASVTFQAPNARCSAEFPGEEPCVSDDVTFDASDSTDPDGDDAALTYEWDLGDGTTATGATVTHSYDTAGPKDVEVTVTDEDGDSSTCGLSLEVAVCAIEVEIDIKPCSDPNAFNPDGTGLVPVGIRQTTDFDPTSQVAVDTIRFGAVDVVEGGDGASPAHGGHVQDVVPCEGDGMDDLVVHVPVADTGFDGDESVGRLEGETQDGVRIYGEDSVKLAGGGNGGGNGGGGGNGNGN